MSTTTEGPDLATLEQLAEDHMAAESGMVEADLEAAAASAGAEAAVDEPVQAPNRLAVAMALPTVGAAIMVGGVFLGVSPRIYAAVAGLLGVGLAIGASRIRRPAAANVVIIGGLFLIGLLMVVPTGLGNLASLSGLVRSAAAAGNVLRPPVEFTAGWHAVSGWLLGIVGFAACWVALVLRKPSIGMLIPLPVAALAGISVPKVAQVPSGIVVLALFAAALGVLSSAAEFGEGDVRPPLAYELKRVGKGLVFIVIVTVALGLLSQSNFLFPEPIVNPAEEAQKPQTQPLSEVEDRVLFEVESSITGPWRLGSLDVYDGKDFRLPPFAQNRVRDVPRSGVVNEDLASAVSARFTIFGLDGAVLPALPNTVGVVARGPRLAFDSRNGNIRLAQGQVTMGQTYAVAAAPVPKVDDLRMANGAPPAALRQFVSVPDMPPAVQAKVDEVTAQFDNKWDRFAALRTFVLENVTSTGVGAPASVPPSRVDDMIGGSQEGTPFEIVAAQALLARWVGVPSRIGYGFDGGEDVAGKFQVRPKHGATFVEVYFPGYEWIPVIGTPKKAKPTVGGNPGQQKIDDTVLPSNEIVTQVYLPLITPPPSILGAQIAQSLLGVALVGLLLFLLYLVYPALRKAVIRSRRRAAAADASARTRIALAYADWRDLATDYGYQHGSDTPLLFLDRFAEDQEHTELAWLVTRALWGDLQGQIGPGEVVAAEELSRALRRRLAQAHPATVRVVAAFSRFSLRDPYAPEINASLTRKSNREMRRVAVPAT